MPALVTMKIEPEQFRLHARVIEIAASVCLSIMAQNGTVDGNALARLCYIDGRGGADTLLSELGRLNRELDYGVSGL